MAKIQDKIDRLEKAIKSKQDTLAKLRHIQDLWDEFGDIPMDPETECLDSPFTPKSQDGRETLATFPAGTFREDIWHWFEETFHISVAEDLMY